MYFRLQEILVQWHYILTSSNSRLIDCHDVYFHLYLLMILFLDRIIQIWPRNLASLFLKMPFPLEEQNTNSPFLWRAWLSHVTELTGAHLLCSFLSWPMAKMHIWLQKMLRNSAHSKFRLDLVGAAKMSLCRWLKFPSQALSTPGLHFPSSVYL